MSAWYSTMRKLLNDLSNVTSISHFSKSIVFTMASPTVSPLNDISTNYTNNRSTNSIDNGVDDIFNVHMKYFLLVTRVCVIPLLSVWSVITGIVNSIAFCKMGLSDGVNQNFLILSVADGLQGLLASADSVVYILQWCEVEDGPIPLATLHAVFLLSYNFPLGVSIITTTVIAVVRCCCVSMPFTVQKTLTARRQLAAILVFSVANMAVQLYAVSQGTVKLGSASIHSTERALGHIFSGDVLIIWDAARVCVFVTCFCIISISMVILMVALKKSSRFQREASGTPQPAGHGGRNRLDTLILKGVLYVLIIFTMCNILLILIALLRIIQPKLQSWRQEREEFFYLFTIRYTLCIINTSVNIFVYYFNIGRFRIIVNRLFCRHGGDLAA